MTFPPTSKKTQTSTSTTTSQTQHDIDLDYSATLHRSSTLTSQLSHTTSATRLLRAQIKREEAALRRDRDELRTLRENASSARAVARERERGLHPLARDLSLSSAPVSVTNTDDEERGVEDELLNAGATARRRRRAGRGDDVLRERDIQADPALAELAEGLRSHLASMRANTAGMGGVRRELGKAEEALDRFVVGRLEDGGGRVLEG
jgi:hypothetical protein